MKINKKAKGRKAVKSHFENIKSFFFRNKKTILLAVLFLVLFLIGITVFLVTRKKASDKIDQPLSLIDQYRNQLPQLEKNAKGGNPNDLQQYGIALYATGDLSKAEEIYHKQAEIDDNNPLVHNNLANTLRDEQKYEEAIKEYRRAIELSPKNLNTYLNLASVYQYSLKDFDGAMKVYEQAMEENPESVDFTNMAGLAAEQKGDKQKAKEYFEKTLTVQNENPVAKSALQRLQ